MSIENSNSQLGVYVIGVLVGWADPNSRGYRDLYLQVNPMYRSERFSVKVGSELEDALRVVAVGDEVTLRVAAPRLATSKAGKPYLGGYFPLALVDEQSGA